MYFPVIGEVSIVGKMSLAVVLLVTVIRQDEHLRKQG